MVEHKLTRLRHRYRVLGLLESALALARNLVHLFQNQLLLPLTSPYALLP